MATASLRWVRPPGSAVRRVASSAWRPHAASSSERPLRLHPAEKLPPRVEHVVAETGGTLRTLLPRVIPGSPRVDETAVRQLVALGAVYYAERPPPRDLAGVPRALRPKRVRDPDQEVLPGSYCRVHVHPKRFPAADAVDWRARVVAHGEDWVVVDKPPGVSVNPTVDNAVECAAALVARALRDADAGDDADAGAPPGWTETDPLTVVHRLDVATSGVVMFARGGGAFASRFHEALRKRRVRKTYRCVSESPPPLGVLEHWTRQEAKTGGTTPRRHEMFPLRPEDARWSGDAEALEATFSREGFKRCVLRVTRVDALARDDAAPEVAFRMDGADVSSTREKAFHDLFECEVELVTGRTHQIRAQFAAVGAPLLGDVLYGGSSLRVGGEANAETHQMPRALDEDDRLCLQSAAMTIDKDRIDSTTPPHETDGRTFEAGKPWWRR